MFRAVPVLCTGVDESPASAAKHALYTLALRCAAACSIIGTHVGRVLDGAVAPVTPGAPRSESPMTHGPDPTPLQEAALEAQRQRTWPDEDDRLTMDLEPYPDSQVY
jgi:hypothetical protein